MAKRNQDPPKAENHERWLLTYADLITLLMIFFIVMYTISNVNSKKFAQLSNSMSQAFLGQASGKLIGEAGPALIPGAGSAAAQAEAAKMKKAKEAIDKYIEQQGLKGKVTADLEERGLVISLKEALLFPLGSANLTPEAQRVIQSVGKMLNSMPNQLRIEGHTDNLPIHTAQFPSNWELSTARATNVVNFLTSRVGITPVKLSATGYGEFRPIVANTNEQARAQNRRVDIVVLRSILDIAEPDQATKTAQKKSDSQTGQPQVVEPFVENVSEEAQTQ
jgi:chemotaxis protein MotB